MDAIDVTQLSAYSTPNSNDILIVIKNADDSLNNTTIGQILALVSVPSAYTSNPAALGTASPGSSTSWARGDHVHAKPTYSKSDVGLGNVDNIRQYSSSNPPPYPVTSVNGSTGAVTTPSPTVTITTNASDPLTLTLDPCPVTYAFGEKSEITVTVTAATQYHFSFTCPSGAATVLTMNGVTGIAGDTLAAGKSYEVDIWDGIALVMEVEATAP